MFVAESCSESGVVSEGRPPAFFKSCTRIEARQESDKGSLGVKTVKLLVEKIGFSLSVRIEYVIMFKRWYALLITN